MAEPALDRALEELRRAELLVPIRSSSGRELDAAGVPVDEMRHGTDSAGRFLAAYTDQRLLDEYGPPGTDLVRIRGAALLELAAAAGERIVIDPGAPQQREVPSEIVVSSRGAPATHALPPPVRRPAPLPELSAAGEIPRGLGDAIRAALDALPQVDRAWLLRRGDGWTIGVLQAHDATLSDFDEVRNQLHAVATEQLGTRRLLAVTDLRAPTLREQYAAVAPPFYERDGGHGRRGGILGRLFGG